MKIRYNANFEGYKTSDATEQHISEALIQFGHTLVDKDEDIYLFHKGVSKEQLIEDLKTTKGLKVCWYFDKIWKDRVKWLDEILPLVDVFFLTDETWAKEHPDKKFVVLRQGCGVGDEGVRVDYNTKIVFTGSIYGDRDKFIKFLSDRFGNDFGVHTNAHNQDLRDLCVSVPILVAPQHPSDDHYWSSRVYLTLGAGGFLLHPRLKGLEEEYADGKEIVFYDSLEDLEQKILYYLDREAKREKIRKAGQKKTLENYTYEHRVKELLNYVLPLTHN